MTRRQTPMIPRGSSPYFSSSPIAQAKEARRGTASSALSFRSRAYTCTVTPDPSSPQESSSRAQETPSYDYYGDGNGTNLVSPSYTSYSHASESYDSQSYITRPSTSYTSRASRTPLPNSDKYEIVCALSEARGVAQSVGMASVNTTTGEVLLSQISDNRFFVRTLHKLHILEPSYILIVSSSCPPNHKSRLYNHIEEHMAGTKIVPFDRRHWSEMEGLHHIDAYAFREDAEAIKVALKGSFYATCALAAAISYLESECSLKIVRHSLRVRYQPCEDTMMIDVSTIISLEILQNLRSASSKDNLLGLLDQTRTRMGTRVLRSNILQPPTLKDEYLESRYEALDELLGSQDMFTEVRSALRSFPDVETLLTKLVIIPNNPSISESEKAMNNILTVKSFLDSVPDLQQALAPASSPLLIKIRNLFQPTMYETVRNLIYETLNEDVVRSKNPLDQRNQRMFAVKSGVNGLLDVARQTYKENTEEVMKHVDLLRTELGIEASLQFKPKRQYYLAVREVEYEDRPIPDILVNRVTKRGKIECTTIRLKQLNQRISDSSAEVVMLSDKVVQDLIDSIRTQIAPLYRISESIALLDMIASFAHVASMYNWVRPDITETLALRAARHPILDKILDEGCVPNDYYAAEDYHFHIITGCNMSGKTTYIRGIALLQIMAQIGCFVPAESATFPIVHSLFARVSTDDSIEVNLSSFSVEMQEMAFILRNVDNRSLVIVDELGRSTSVQDGLAIAIAMAEAMIQSRATVMFATHFMELAEVLADRPGVLNTHLACHTSTTEDGLPKLTMTYKIQSGKAEQTLYGITLAKAIGFPKRFIEVAEYVARTLREQREKNRQSSEARRMLDRRKLILNLHANLKQANESELDEPALASYLDRLREEFIERMEALQIDDGDTEAGDAEEFDEEDDQMVDDDNKYDDEDVFDDVDIESICS
ncbi:DNA mismatch repair protein msh4 [Colletotrichum plurivorum]|uniref:DNA mismatch repair protein MSH3 n=1 Tax=Colletotrichum plurivorum TaxID=2175906 RepID=A0A8H6K2V8_9PEZI|nr:DNA mismatch repair protein msh4 [Colletotrichum plurivorum]